MADVQNEADVRARQDGLVFEVGTTDFDERVVRESFRRPVLVELVSQWCSACQELTPVLEKVVRSYDGRAALARITVDREKELAAAFRVEAVPAVKIIREGKVVGEFAGAAPEEDLRHILSHFIPSEADEIAVKAAGLHKAGKLDEAEALHREALLMSPGHPGATLGLARIAVERGDFEAARALASSVEPSDPEHEVAEGLLAQLDFMADCRSQGGMAQVEGRAAAAPDDLDACYALAVCFAGEGKYERALESFLSIVERDKKYRDGAAKDGMVRLFSIVGKRSDLADEYRSRLARLLY